MSIELAKITQIILSIADPDLTELYLLNLEAESFQMEVAKGDKFINILENIIIRNQTNPLAIIDVSKRIQGGTCADDRELAMKVRRLEVVSGIYIPTIITTSYNKPENLKSLRKWADIVLPRPFDMNQLSEAARFLKDTHMRTPLHSTN